MYGYLIWTQNGGLDAAMPQWLGHLLQPKGSAAQVKLAEDNARKAFAKACPSQYPLSKQLNPQSMLALFSRVEPGLLSFGMAVWLAHHRLQPLELKVRTVTLEALVSDQLSDEQAMAAEPAAGAQVQGAGGRTEVGQGTRQQQVGERLLHAHHVLVVLVALAGNQHHVARIGTGHGQRDGAGAVGLDQGGVRRGQPGHHLAQDGLRVFAARVVAGQHHGIGMQGGHIGIVGKHGLHLFDGYFIIFVLHFNS